MNPNNLYLIIGSIFIVVVGIDVYNWLKGRAFTKPEIRIQRLRSTVNFAISIVATGLTLISIAFHINIFDYTSPIEYSDINSVSLKDFKGYRLPNQTLDGINEFAFITTSIEWRIDDKNLEVKSLFHPSRSYVFNENIADHFLLQHELYHFHITEYFARRIRCALKKLNSIPPENEIKSIILHYKDLENSMQSEYDYSTYHGYILKEQKQWQLKVDSLLTLTNNFTSTKISYK